MTISSDTPIYIPPGGGLTLNNPLFPPIKEKVKVALDRSGESPSLQEGVLQKEDKSSPEERTHEAMKRALGEEPPPSQKGRSSVKQFFEAIATAASSVPVAQGIDYLLNHSFSWIFGWAGEALSGIGNQAYQVGSSIWNFFPTSWKVFAAAFLLYRAWHHWKGDSLQGIRVENQNRVEIHLSPAAIPHLVSQQTGKEKESALQPAALLLSAEALEEFMTSQGGGKWEEGGVLVLSKSALLQLADQLFSKTKSCEKSA